MFKSSIVSSASVHTPLKLRYGVKSPVSATVTWYW